MVLIGLAVLLQFAVLVGFTSIFAGAREEEPGATPAEVTRSIRQWLRLSWVGGSAGAGGLVLLIAAAVRRRRAARAAAAGN